MLICAGPCPAGSKLVHAWTPQVTHVVCQTNENQQARRTLKFMQVGSRNPPLRQRALPCLRGTATTHPAPSPRGRIVNRVGPRHPTRPDSAGHPGGRLGGSRLLGGGLPGGGQGSGRGLAPGGRRHGRVAAGQLRRSLGCEGGGRGWPARRGAAAKLPWSQIGRGSVVASLTPSPSPPISAQHSWREGPPCAPPPPLPLRRWPRGRRARGAAEEGGRRSSAAGWLQLLPGR